jgi:hypothetical protein
MESHGKYIFDVVVSDFGRESAIEYLRLAAVIERRIIQSQLDEPNSEFYDEYRRIMFVLVADLAYFKQPQIRQLLASGHLSPEILLGLGGDVIPEDIRDRLARTIIEQICFAMIREYNNIRIVIPCNTLSSIGPFLKDLLGDEEKTRMFFTDLFGMDLLSKALPRWHDTTFQVCTVPGIILDELRDRHKDSPQLLVLGTPATVDTYISEIAKLGDSWKNKVCSLTGAEQQLVNETIVAAIGGDANTLRHMGQRIENEIISHYRANHGNLMVIEACTDFNLGLGLNTREVFVERLVRDAYGLDVHTKTGEPA